MKSGLIAAIALAFGLLSAAPASAGTVRIGTLVCDVEGGAGLILGSRKSLGCDFNNFSGPNEIYDGSVLKIGVDVGFTAGARLIWAVFAPSLDVGPGLLEGHYVGVGAEATPAVGLGANVLIGGFDRSINLQPISVQGQTGVNLSGGITALRLISPPVVRKR